MNHYLRYSELASGSWRYLLLVALLVAIASCGLYAAHYMDVAGHHVTGMDNQIVWGLPHVMALFLIVSASGALNIASLASVFGKMAYQPLARFSAITAVALLAGGVSILILDLGRPERLIIAITHYNFTSVFSWNIFLYTSFGAIVIVYLWFLMERRYFKNSKVVGVFAFFWRLILTAGTGLIFAVLVAREAYSSWLLPPLFIAMSFSFGLAIFSLLLIILFKFEKRVIHGEILLRLNKLMAIFIAANLLFEVVFYTTKLAGNSPPAIEFLLLDSHSPYALIFWVVHIGLGCLLPLLICSSSKYGSQQLATVLISFLVIVGAVAQIYVILIGGQAYPLSIFPGYEVSSHFFDGTVNEYQPGLWEYLLGGGGLALSMLLVFILVRVLPILPEKLVLDTKINDGNPPVYN